MDFGVLVDLALTLTCCEDFLGWTWFSKGVSLIMFIWCEKIDMFELVSFWDKLIGFEDTQCCWLACDVVEGQIVYGFGVHWIVCCEVVGGFLDLNKIGLDWL